MAETFDGNDKGACGGVDGGFGAEEARLVVRYQERDEEEGDNIEDGDAPEYLADGGRDGFTRVGGFSSCEAYKFCAGKGECGRDEDVAETFEAIFGCAWVDPVLAAYVAAMRCSANVDDDA